MEQVDPDLQRFPRFRTHCVKPVSCTVKKGDILYLPALWYVGCQQMCTGSSTPKHFSHIVCSRYHRVAQKGLTIAVNYWHDMDFMGSSIALLAVPSHCH